MELLEDVFIRCEQCGRIIGIHKEDFDFESYVYDHGENGCYCSQIMTKIFSPILSHGIPSTLSITS